MQLKMPRERLRAGVIIALLIWIVMGVLQWRHALERVEWITYDYRMKFWRTGKPLHPDIAVVIIDEQSLAAMDPYLGRFPWPRSAYGDLIEEFFLMGGARAVVFDILFTEQEHGARTHGPTPSDLRLIQAGQTAGNVIHAAQFVREVPDEVDTGTLFRPLPEDFRNRFAVKDATNFADRGNNSYRLPLDGLYQTSRGIGGVGVDADRDGIFRRTNLFFTYQDAVFPSLGVAPVLDAMATPIQANEGEILFGDVTVPLDSDGHFLVHMCGDVHPYSIAGIFDSIMKIKQGDIEHLLVDPFEFQNKVVFIGASAAGLSDLKATPLSTKTPGVLIHASIATNLLERDFLTPAPAWASFLVAISLAIAAVFIILTTNRIALQFALPTFMGLAYGLLALWSFGQGVVLEMAAPLTAVALGVVSTSAFLVFTEGREKRRVRAMFSQYVSPAVLDEVVDNYKNQLRAEVGTREHLSILFSDVRGFTSLSEKLEAEQVVDLLNIHFSVMGEIIFRYQGTLDKFIGDAIMAFWGAPIPVTDHARKSVCAAVEMWRHMNQVNEQLAAKGYPPIDVGIGINTGDVVLGNIGSERKLDYTIIGDHVNLGSRLEGLTKQYGCHIIISEYTYRELAGEIPCAVVDLVRVKGKQVPIRIYWPLALPDDPPADMARARTVAELSEQAFSAYLARRFDQAADLYAQLPESHLRDLFITRCKAYSVEPPDAEWDGVYTLTTK